MLKKGRICIPLGLACNFKCRYCYRELIESQPPLELSPLMAEYLKTIDASWCQAVVMSGGEPLIYFDKIKEIFGLVKADVHKKIMSNGSLLTQEIVDYINKNKIELMLSHDAAPTAYLRGRDVLEEENILNLVKQVKILTVFSVITRYNVDVVENFHYIAKKLGRTNFFYYFMQVYDNGNCHDLIDGFDYDTFDRSYREYRQYYHHDVPYYADIQKKNYALNVDLSGNVVEKNTNIIVGTVNNTFEELVANYEKLFAEKYCRANKCLYRDFCPYTDAAASEHYCKCLKITGGWI